MFDFIFGAKLPVMDKWHYSIGPLNVLVEGVYKPGDNYTVSVNTVQPPDPRTIDIKHVWLAMGEKKVDILPSLSGELLEQIEGDLLGTV